MEENEAGDNEVDTGAKMKINNDFGNEVVKWTNEVGLIIDNSLLKIIKIFKS